MLIAAAGQQLLLPLQLPLLPLHELLQLLLQSLPLLLALGLLQAVAVVTRQGQVERQGRLGWTAARLSPAAIATAAAVELQPMAIQLAEPLLPTLKQLLPLRSGEIGGDEGDDGDEFIAEDEAPDPGLIRDNQTTNVPKGINRLSREYI